AAVSRRTTFCQTILVNSTRPLKHRAVVIGRHVNSVAELEAARLNTCDCLFGGHPQLSRWPSRLSYDRRFLARSRVPTHNSKEPAWLKNIVDHPCESRLVRNTVERVCEEHVVNRLRHDLLDVVCVSLDKSAIWRATAFGYPHLGCF